MRYYIIAGEKSGDLHASNLMKALNKRDPSATFRGFGGDLMKAEGLDLAVHYDEMAFMGLKALFVNAWTIYQKIKFCKQDIRRFRPDAIILVDYGGFNRRIAKFGKRNSIPVLYYISPKVWAWYTSRAWELRRNVDRMFVILPFEKAFFRKFDFDVNYVGNPVLDAVKDFRPDPSFLSRHGFDSSKKIVALLPGSRRMELKKIVPLMASVAGATPEFQFVVAAIPSLPAKLYEPLRAVPGVKFVSDETYDLLTHAAAAMVTSGTATLETALFRVPQVVVYRISILENAFGRMVVKVPYLSLVNLIADGPVVKELIQDQANLKNTTQELRKLVQDNAYREKILTAYNDIYRTLNSGSASENTAELIMQFLTTP